MIDKELLDILACPVCKTEIKQTADETGLKCPQCGNETRLRIEGTSVFEVVDDGTESHGSVEWDDNSVTQCPECHLAAGLAHFRVLPEAEKKLYKVVAHVRRRYTANVEATSPREALEAAQKMSDDVSIEDWDAVVNSYSAHFEENPQEVEDDA